MRLNICFAVFGTIKDRNMSDVEGDVPSAAPVEAAGPMGINEAIQEVLKQVRAQSSLFLTTENISESMI